MTNQNKHQEGPSPEVCQLMLNVLDACIAKRRRQVRFYRLMEGVSLTFLVFWTAYGVWKWLI